MEAADMVAVDWAEDKWVATYVTVLGWRLKTWGLLDDRFRSQVESMEFLCDTFRLEAEDMVVAKWHF